VQPSVLSTQINEIIMMKNSLNNLYSNVKSAGRASRSAIGAKCGFLALICAAALCVTEVYAQTSGGITVRARGISGAEHINLRVGGTTVANWTLTTSLKDYIYSSTASGDIQVQYDNDATGRDAIVDYIHVNNETRQAESMKTNTGAYANGACGGGSYSETMNCNGYIDFGYTYDCFSGACGTSASSSSSSTATATCKGYVGITFDDGPTSNTGALITQLKQNKLTPVTWFNWGAHVTSNPSMIPQEMVIGVVQNHSYTHPHMAGYTVAQVNSELSQTNQAIQAAGAPKPTVFRPPYGESSTNVQQAAQALGLRVVTWDVDSQDWNGASTAAIVNANNQLQNGQVILMHDGYINTNNAIAQIAVNLKAKGLCPGKIDPSTGRAVAP
jgi:peptidoglycan/xylan/chitin deacetylase (PgdA/CDA1 family)